MLITSPGPPATRSTLPEYGDGSSTTALAVSIDTSGSSRLMVSPTLTIHSTISASGRPSPKSGRKNVLLLAMLCFSAQLEAKVRLVAAMIFSTLGRYFISSRNSGM